MGRLQYYRVEKKWYAPFCSEFVIRSLRTGKLLSSFSFDNERDAFLYAQELEERADEKYIRGSW